MAQETTFRRLASELTKQAGSTEDEDRQDRLLQRAAHYVMLAENESWLHSNSMTVGDAMQSERQTPVSTGKPDREPR